MKNNDYVRDYIFFKKKYLIIDLHKIVNKDITTELVYDLYAFINEYNNKLDINLLIPKRYNFKFKENTLKNNKSIKENIFFYNLLQYLYDLDSKKITIIRK